MDICVTETKEQSGITTKTSLLAMYIYVKGNWSDETQYTKCGFAFILQT